MAQIPVEIINSIKDFIAEAEKNNIHIQQAILYGSYAKGTNHKWSDIDLAVVSDDFIGNLFYDYDLFLDAIVKVNNKIEPYPYRPEDFTSENPFVKEILKEGIRII